MTKDHTKPQEDTKLPKRKGQLPEPPKSNVVDIKDKQLPPCEYNIKEMTTFINTVFHTEDENSEGNVMFWKTNGGSPGYPMDEDRFIKALKGATLGHATYFGTSTCRADDKGNLRNRKNLFDKLHVVVLDDIGTKVAVAKIPKDLKPTYIIESSEGNFQYGYVLEKPIDVLEHAEALIQLVYETGLSDTGGKMPTKLVRMPCGVNGKDGPRGEFKVKLHKIDGPLWTPDRLFEVMDLGVSWNEVLDDVESVLKQRPTRYNGVSPWSPVKAHHAALGGIIDPALEWLSDENYIQQETDEWVTIKCPWHKLHSEGTGDTAGYIPLGQGDNPNMRVFSCFHSHGETDKTQEFLNFIANSGGPECAMFDNAAHLVAAYAFDQSTNSVWKIKDVDQPRLISMDAFRNTYPKKVRVAQYGKKVPASIAEHALWLHSPARVILHGRTFEPGTNAKVVENPSSGELLVNMFYRPDWGDGDYDDDEVDRFLHFIEYLIPKKFERDYFLEWLAAKAQNMGFRGASIVMIAKQQGTGRATLGALISELFGSINVEAVPFEKMVGENQYNDWMETPIIITNETKDLGTGSNKSFYRSYERLKDLVDPMPQEVRINPKYGTQRLSKVHSSFLMFSNHDNALAVADNDRRFFILRNAVTPAHPEYFTELHEWRERKDTAGRPAWAKSVWRWLQQQDVDLTMLHAPAPSTAAKQDMIKSSKNPLTIATEAAINAHKGMFISYHQIRSALDHCLSRLDIDGSIPDRQLQAIIHNHTQSLGSDAVLKFDNRTVTPKIKLMALKDKDVAYKYGGERKLSERTRAVIRADLNLWNREDAIENINTALDLME